MALPTRPLHACFGVEVLDVDVGRLDDERFGEVVALFEDHSVLLFRGQTLGDEDQIVFSRRFGPLEISLRTIMSLAQVAPEISNLANVDAEDRLIPSGDRRNLFRVFAVKL